MKAWALSTGRLAFLHAQDVPEEVAVASVQEAFRLGINFFDTSPYYASTKVRACRTGRGSTPARDGSSHV